jgi:lipoyl(octanoyl) transferase
MVLEKTRIRSLGRRDYSAALASMREFTARRDGETRDELWLLEHPPVYTLGQGADPAFGPKRATGIPLVHADRGGEITYHGPGQVVLYTLVDLRRRGIQVREFVRLLERSVVELLSEHGIASVTRSGAPGVYVNGAKVAALGIRVSRGCAYHGLALNVEMDLSPFAVIDPCGYPGLAVTQTRDLGITDSREALGAQLAESVARRLDHA